MTDSSDDSDYDAEIEADAQDDISEDDIEEDDTEVDQDIASNINESKLITVKITAEQNRITHDRMTLCELSSIIGIRAQQIENSDMIYCDIEDETDAIKIAKKELKLGVCPLCIEREISRKGNVVHVEIWDANELTLPNVKL